jgi:HD-like signal output (HDOD) protein
MPALHTSDSAVATPPTPIHATDADAADTAAALARTAEECVREIRIPPCPEVLARFSTEMRAPSPDLRRLAKLIGTDAGLSASLLKTVNSAFYRLSARASTVQQALSILGLRASANLLAGLMLREAFPVPKDRETERTMARFWSGTAELAQCAAGLAGRLRGVAPDEAHTYMLFRDCGIAAMIGQFDDYEDVLDAFLYTPGARVTVMETARYRFNHTRVGYAFTRNWMLPEALCQSILYHHDFEQLGANVPELGTINHRLIAFGLLAEQIVALRRGEGLCPDWAPQERFVLETLSITPEEIVVLLEGDVCTPPCD